MKKKNCTSRYLHKTSLKAVGILAIAVLASTLAGCDQKDIASKVSYVPVKVSKYKWSFIDTDGKVACVDEFENCPTMVYNGFFSYENEDGYGLYKIEKKQPVTVGDLSGLQSIGYVEENKVPATITSHRIGVFDTAGKNLFEIQPVNGKEITMCSAGYSDDRLLIVDEEEKIGYIDGSGKTIISPVYTEGFDFSNGLAVVGNSSEDSYDVSYSVIDTSGKTIFKLRSDQRPSSYCDTPGLFDNGYLIIMEDDRDVLYNSKGEIFKFPARIKRIVKTDGKYIIFKNEDGEYGVANMEGEVFVSPRYENIQFLAHETFYAVEKERGIFLNRKGEITSQLNYEYSTSFGKFGFFVSDDDEHYRLVDEKGKEKGKEDFYRYNIEKRSYSSFVRTDYIDIEGAAKSIVDMISGDVVGPYTLCSTPGVVFNNLKPQDLERHYPPYTLDKIDINGYRYHISATGKFSSNLVYAERPYYSYYSYYDYDYTYTWNVNSYLYEIDLKISTDSEWGKSGFDAVVDHLKTKGFNPVKSGGVDYDYAALLKKGAVYIYVDALQKGRTGTITILSSNISQGKERINYLEGQIKDKPKSRDIYNVENPENTEACEEEVYCPEYGSEGAVEYMEYCDEAPPAAEVGCY